VPQFILEDASAARCGGALDIICTQPRRISALGLAHRVSSERGEEARRTAAPPPLPVLPLASTPPPPPRCLPRCAPTRQTLFIPP